MKHVWSFLQNIFVPQKTAVSVEVMPAPRTILPRHPCPFYGFSHFQHGFMVDSEGNQCSLISESHSPCLMEMEGRTPDWQICDIMNEGEKWKLMRAIPDDYKVFPREFRPEPQAGWRGIRFKDWMHYVMRV